MGYARILKDNNGKPSGYRECDGEVAFMPEQQSYENIFRRVKIDIETMEILNHDFIRDKQRVYRKGVLLRGITPEGFHVYNGIYIGTARFPRQGFSARCRSRSAVRKSGFRVSSPWRRLHKVSLSSR